MALLHMSHSKCCRLPDPEHYRSSPSAVAREYKDRLIVITMAKGLLAAALLVAALVPAAGAAAIGPVCVSTLFSKGITPNDYTNPLYAPYVGGVSSLPKPYAGAGFCPWLLGTQLLMGKSNACDALLTVEATIPVSALPVSLSPLSDKRPLPPSPFPLSPSLWANEGKTYYWLFHAHGNVAKVGIARALCGQPAADLDPADRAAGWALVATAGFSGNQVPTATAAALPIPVLYVLWNAAANKLVFIAPAPAFGDKIAAGFLKIFSDLWPTVQAQLVDKAPRVDAVLIAPPNVGGETWARNFNRLVNARRIAFTKDLTPCSLGPNNMPGCPSTPSNAALAALGIQGIATNKDPITGAAVDSWDFGTIGGNMPFAPLAMPEARRGGEEGRAGARAGAAGGAGPAGSGLGRAGAAPPAPAPASSRSDPGAVPSCSPAPASTLWQDAKSWEKINYIDICYAWDYLSTTHSCAYQCWLSTHAGLPTKAKCVLGADKDVGPTDPRRCHLTTTTDVTLASGGAIQFTAGYAFDFLAASSTPPNSSEPAPRRAAPRRAAPRALARRARRASPAQLPARRVARLTPAAPMRRAAVAISRAAAASSRKDVKPKPRKNKVKAIIPSNPFN
eukprot:scaffold15.g4288.t1